MSFVTTQMERIENGQEDEMTAKCAAAAAYLGEPNSHFTGSTLTRFDFAFSVL